MAMWRVLDPQAEVETGRRLRESTRMTSVSQPFAAAWLRMLPSSHEKRIRSDKFLWAYQRRFGLHVTGAPAEAVRAMRAEGVVCGDLGDEFLAAGDRRPPHDDSLRVWHDMAQASATSPVTLGDKERPEDYLDFNDGHVLDMGETRQGKGGVDRVVEWKAYSPLVQVSTSPPMDTSYRGSTHAFGNTEEHLRRANIGVKAQEGDQRWDNAKGTGKVRAHKGLYHDAIHVKRNEFWLAIAEIFGGLNKVARRLFKLYKERARHGVDRTQYVASDSGASHFGAHWSQLLSAAIVIGDARRSLRAVDMKRRACAAAAAARPRPQTAGRATTAT